MGNHYCDADNVKGRFVDSGPLRLHFIVDKTALGIFAKRIFVRSMSGKALAAGCCSKERTTGYRAVTLSLIKCRSPNTAP